LNTTWKEAKAKVENDYKLKKIKKKDIDAIEYLHEFCDKIYSGTLIQNSIAD